MTDVVVGGGGGRDGPLEGGGGGMTDRWSPALCKSARWGGGEGGAYRPFEGGGGGRDRHSGGGADKKKLVNIGPPVEIRRHHRPDYTKWACGGCVQILPGWGGGVPDGKNEIKEHITPYFGVGEHEFNSRSAQF